MVAARLGRRGSACGPWPHAARGRPRPGPRSCRRRRARFPGHRTSSPRSADAQYQTPRPSKSTRPGNVGPAIACAAGDDDRARAQPAIVGEPHRHVRARVSRRAFERRRLRRNQDLRAELLRLDEGASGQRLARDSGRKAEVVLDARAGTGLAAEGPAIEHDDAKAFRGRVDRGGEARRPGADHGDVEQLVVLGRCRPCRGGGRARPRSG